MKTAASSASLGKTLVPLLSRRRGMSGILFRRCGYPVLAMSSRVHMINQLWLFCYFYDCDCGDCDATSPSMSSGVQRIVSNFSFSFRFPEMNQNKVQIFLDHPWNTKYSTQTWLERNFVILEKPKYKIFSTEVNRKKVQIILVILCFSLVGAFILTLVNVSHDLQVYSGIWKKSFLQHQHQEIRTFYKGFMGRKLLLSEQLLLHRQKVSKQRLETFTIDQIVK